MNEEKNNTVIEKEKHQKRYSTVRKKEICEKWKNSVLSKKLFCKEYGIGKSTLYKWQKAEDKPEAKVKMSSSFLRVSPVVCEDLKKEAMVGIKINLPNQSQLQLELDYSQLIEFVQGLCHATAIIR